MKLNHRICGCGNEFSFPKKRGRPPVDCPSCKKKGIRHSKSKPANLESELEAAKAELEALRASQPKSDPIQAALFSARVRFPSDQAVRVLDRLWRGVPIPSRTGKIRRWETDKYGPVAVVRLRGGSECLARPEMMELR